MPTGSEGLREHLIGTLLGCVLVLAGCAPGADLPALPDYITQSYQLGGGDQIRIIVFGEDQLTGEFRVDEQGGIAIPLLGEVRAVSLTTEDLSRKIAVELKRRNLLSDPSVSVQVLAYRPIFVLGEVAHPGQYPYAPGMTMLTAVAIAGGFTYRAVEDDASVVRSINGIATEGLITPKSFIAPGDVIKVFERRF